MNGILVVNKPQDFTSRDVVNKVGGILKTKKIGHTGTLDPIATGVLVICIGNTTKLCEVLTSEYKEYIATIKLGIKTDTGDITGNINNQTDLKNKFDNINGSIQSLDIDMSTNYQNLNDKFDNAIQNLEQDFSTSTKKLEIDIQDTEDRLQSQINTLSSIGQFLAIWDCDTGIARYLNEGFEYQTGNYFIIGTIAEGEGAINYMPDGNTYPGKVEATEEDIKVSDMWFYDGEHWIYLANHERAVAVDADLDVNSTNPIENQAVAKAVDGLDVKIDDLDVKIDDTVDTINVSIEELKNRPIPIAVPQLASVDVNQVKTPEEKAARLVDDKLDEAEALAELNQGADSKIEDIKSKYSAANDNIEAELAALKAGLNQ